MGNEKADHPPTRLEKLWKEAGKGVAAVGALLSATSVTHLVAHALHIPLSSWLSHAFAAYTALFHPIIETLVDPIVSICGYHLTASGKDIVVIYSVMGSAHFRSLASDHPFRLRLAIAILWPFALFFTVLLIIWLPLALLGIPPFRGLIKGKQFGYEQSMIIVMSVVIGLTSMKEIIKQIVFVAVIVGAAILLNASGILK